MNDTLIAQIGALVKECGAILLTADRAKMQIDEKGGSANFVTEYDKKAQDFLFAGLSEILPEAHFIGEEGEQDRSIPDGFCFIVDPIDGTTNFIKDYHMSSISVGLLKDGKAYLGVIYNPYLDELYWAKRGEGAFCNGEPIRVSSRPLSQGIVLFGTAPYNKDTLAEDTFRMMYEYYMKSLDIRRSGSAALDFCAVAAGRAELFFELILSPWDFAAGALIVEEAGGIVTTLDGKPLRYDDKISILARNAAIG